LTNTLFPGPAGPPAVMLGSGPGPSPSLDPNAGGPPVRAILQEADHETGLRGWSLVVSRGDRPAVWPRHHFSRGARPPLIGARETALRALGYEPEPGEEWCWQESTTLDGKRVTMYAGMTVRAVARDQAAAL